MLVSSARYKPAITRPHQLHFDVDLMDGDGNVLASNVPVFGGSVSANLTHRVTRTADFTVGPEWWPGTDPAAPLSPFQSFARVRAGIRYGDGSTETFPLITGRVGDVSRGTDGSVTARVDDLAADVIALRFEQPRNSENVSVLSQIRRLISEVLPDASFGTDDVPDAMTPKLTWDEDRGDALDKLAETLGGRWYCLGDGSFVVRAYPYDVGTPVQTVRDGDDGLLIDASASVTRDGAANSVTVVVERADGGTPFRVRARDESASSPTRYGDRFGRISRVIKVQTPLTEGQAATYARAQLRGAVALSETWSVSMVPDFTLEPGDTVRLGSRGASSVQLIDQIRYPLDPGAMTLTTRAYVRTTPSLA